MKDAADELVSLRIIQDALGGDSYVPPAWRDVIKIFLYPFDLEVEEASRCFVELAGNVPNVMGSVQIEFPAVRRSDTARRDFREALRRKRGFEFRIAEGGLKLQEVTQPPSPVRVVDFRGGSASLRTIEPGSDAARLLAPFESPRKMILEVSARDGTKLSFPLYMTDLR